MTVWLHHLETLVPPHSYSQDYASEKMQQWSEDERQKRLIRALYRRSGIERRHSVVATFDDDGPEAFFQRDGEGRLKEPGTAQRNAIYARESHRLAVELADRAIARCPGVTRKDITHVVTASCTGFFNPGPDFFIVHELELSHATQRYHLGFMGCYAALPALRMAKQFCLADPEAVVLVLCLELCTLHLRLGEKEDFLLANSLFADGAAAAVVSARTPLPEQPAFAIDSFQSALIPTGLKDMAWTVGDLGFDIALSSYVPDIIGSNIREKIMFSLAAQRREIGDVTTWAVHPGGKAIVDKVAQSLDLQPPQVAASREVLRRHGNMSSATILFVLAEILRNPAAQVRETVCALAFGPGLTVEMALLRAHRGDTALEGGSALRARLAS